MANTTESLTNVTLLSKEQYDGISDPSKNELWAVETPVVVENYQNGTSWYRVYSDGWVEQGGVATGAYSDNYHRKITFLKEMIDTNYNVCLTGCANDQNNFHLDTFVLCTYLDDGKTTTQMVVAQSENNPDKSCIWSVKGYIR
jgi:hypothetical protein